MSYKKRLIITSLISIILVSLLFLGSTYSIFTSSDIDENLNSYTTGNLSVTVEGGSNVSLNDSLPTSSENAGSIVPYRIVVKNTGNVPYMFHVILADTTAGDKIDYKYLMTKVGKLEDKSLDSCTETTVTVNGTSYTGRIIKEGIIIPSKKGDVETVVNIDVRVWISDTVQNTEIGKSFYGKLLIDGQAVYDYNEDIDNSVLEYPSSSLYYTLANNAVMDNTSSEFVSSGSGVYFSAVSSNTNGKGLYLRAGTENDTYPIYYYRGAVTNNNVIFANFCWKIVRTTETGGIKLIYNGTPTDGTCDNTGESSQIGTSAFNSNYSSPADVGYMVGDRYTYSSKSMSSQTGTWYFGNSITYSGETYTLTNTITMDVSTWSSNYNTLSSNHYTCFSTGTTCSTVYYVYYTNSSTAYYISLTNGKTVENALSEMLSESSNENNSTIKILIDTWYQSNMTEYTDNYLEDTVWCNDRSIGTLNGWDPNGGSTTSYLYFSPRNRAWSTYQPSLSCSNPNDKFTVSSENGNGKLTYPVALLTVDEIMLAGGRGGSSNSSYYLYTGVYWWALSPYCGNNYAGGFYVYSSGNLGDKSVYNTYGVRPAISLQPGIEIDSGDGTVENPYKILTN